MTLPRGVWYYWNKETDEVIDAADRYQSMDDMSIATREASIDARRVALDRVGPYTVSTVFLMVNYNFNSSDADKGIFFETMIFHAKGEEIDIVQNRYSTAAEARAGHAATVDEIILKIS